MNHPLYAAPDAGNPRHPAPQPAFPGAVTRLTLTDFRTFPDLRLAADARCAVLTGPNGAGKTNLLEALSFLAPGRGLRSARLPEATRHGAAGGWSVAATLANAAGAVEVATGLAGAGASERRVVKIDARPVRGQATLAEVLSVIWLTPRMDRLFGDAAQARRRFLDRLVFAFDPGHAQRVASYERTVRERTRLLKDGSNDAAWLGALEATLAQLGVAISAARRDAVARLAAGLATQATAFPRAAVSAVGTVEAWLDAGPAVEVEGKICAALRDARGRDAVTGGAAVGPHRSDLAVRHVERDIEAAQASTGEQKALLIAIILASARVQAALRGATPVLLLDEVAAHLDGARREALFDEICALRAQAWLTGTDRSVFAGLDGRAQFASVGDGRAWGLEL